MRINQYVARASGLSRRSADTAIENGRVLLNDKPAEAGTRVATGDTVHLDGKPLILKQVITIALNKPTGYVCSRDGQGSQTVYELLPPALKHLKTIGRLDKDSSGLIIMTNDGTLAQELTHPKYQKTKRYEVELNKPLTTHHKRQIEQGVMLEDGLSSMQLSGNAKIWQIIMSEGRNRQIRRTFAALGYRVSKLHRTMFGEFELGDLKLANYTVLC